MILNAVSSDSSKQAVTNQINAIQRDIQNSKVTQIFKDDTGDRRVLFGKGEDGFYGLKVSKPGYDVHTAADEDLIFNSSQNIFKIVGTYDITSPSYTTAVVAAGDVGLDVSATSVAHGLSFIPALVAYIADSGTYYPLNRVTWGIDAGNIKYGQFAFQVYADATDITFQIITFLSAIGAASGVSASSTGFTIKVYALQETAN